MSWTDRLQPASFRGIPFKVDGDDLSAGRRTVIHEYPGRDTPSTEDMGRETREYSISAYVIGPDFMAVRDQLITAIETAGPGELVSPFYGAMQVVMQGKQRISHSKADGGMCTIAFSFVEAGEDDWPTTQPLGSSLLSARSGSLLEKAQDYFASTFDLSGLPEWMSLSTVDRASSMLGDIAGYIETANHSMGKAMRLMQGDMSVLLPPPSTGWTFARRLGDVLDVSSLFSSNANSILGSSNASSGSSSSSASSGSNLTRPVLALSTTAATASMAATARPTGVWPGDSADRKHADTLANTVAALVRVNLITTSADAIAALPDNVPQQTNVTSHQALNVDITTSPAEIVTVDELEQIKQGLVQAIDSESERTTDDGVYQALRELRREVITTVKQRQQGSQPLRTVTPADVTPALVLAAEWYDDASRADEIVTRNSIAHPGFVHPAPLRILSS